MKQIHLYISGFVQGVGYRAHTRYKAKQLGLVGWVKNLPDGRVEAVIQGSEEKLKKMMKLCEKGSYFAQVKEIVVEWEDPAKKFSEFTIIRE